MNINISTLSSSSTVNLKERFIYFGSCYYNLILNRQRINKKGNSTTYLY